MPKIDLDKLIDLVKESDSWDQFKEKIMGLGKSNVVEITATDESEEELSDFNKKLKQGLEWNPKEHKKK